MDSNARTDEHCKQREILRKNQKEMRFKKKKKTLIKRKNPFDGLSSRLDTAEKRISELEDVSIESLKTEKQRQQRLQKIE